MWFWKAGCLFPTSVTEKNPVTCTDCEKLLFYQSTDITIILFGKTLTSEQTSRENIFKAKQKVPLKRVQLPKYILPSVKSLKKKCFSSHIQNYMSALGKFSDHMCYRGRTHIPIFLQFCIRLNCRAVNQVFKIIIIK